MMILNISRGIPVWLVYWKVDWPLGEHIDMEKTHGHIVLVDRSKWNITNQEREVCDKELGIISFVVQSSIKLKVR